jgi:hypothetical protein
MRQTLRAMLLAYNVTQKKKMKLAPQLTNGRKEETQLAPTALLSDSKSVPHKSTKKK